MKRTDYFYATMYAVRAALWAFLGYVAFLSLQVR